MAGTVARGLFFWITGDRETGTIALSSTAICVIEKAGIVPIINLKPIRPEPMASTCAAMAQR